MPDYKIKLWNERNFDVNCCQYTAEAYKEKKFAFVSDYVRYYVIYQHGGIYLDTDVELLKPLDDILSKGPFMGCENLAIEGEYVNRLNVAPGLGIGAEAGLAFYKEMIDLYHGLSFYKNDGSRNLHTVVYYTSEKLRKHGLVDKDDIQEVCGIRVYPKEYFCPIDTRTRERVITPNTYSIHYFSGSWVEDPPMIAFRKWLRRSLGESFYNNIRRVKLLVFPKPWEWK